MNATDREQALMVAADVRRMYERHRPLFYVLDEHRNVVGTNDAELLAAMSFDDKRVALTWLWDLRVSTVFLGIDHNFGVSGPPLVFETMVFHGDGSADLYCARSRTWREALEEHDVACSLIRMAKAHRVDPVDALHNGVP